MNDSSDMQAVIQDFLLSHFRYFFPIISKNIGGILSKTTF